MINVGHETSVGELASTVESGEYIGRLVRIAVLGTRQSKPSDQHAPEPQIWLGWELPLALEENGFPKMIGKYYTHSMARRSSLRRDLSAIRGKLYTEIEAMNFDIRSALGSVCALDCRRHYKAGRQYVDVAALSALPKHTEPPTQVNPSIYFDPIQYSLAMYYSLPEPIRNRIAMAPEYEATSLNANGLMVVENVELA
jgi:hypothetical protein